MPDKHEVGGSSPLGPTNRTKVEYESFKKRKRLFSSKARDKFLKVVRVHLGLPARKTGKKEMFIENRINKRNETDSCILRKTCY